MWKQLYILYDVHKIFGYGFYTLAQIIASESLRESIFITSIMFVAVEWIIIITDNNVIERERKCVIVFHLNVRLAVPESRKFLHRCNDKMMKRKEHRRCRVCLWFVSMPFYTYFHRVKYIVPNFLSLKMANVNLSHIWIWSCRWELGEAAKATK